MRIEVCGLERIADGEVEGDSVFPEVFDVVVAGFAGFVWSMDCNTHIETEDEEFQVVSDTESGAEGYLFEESVGTEICSFWTKAARS